MRIFLLSLLVALRAALLTAQTLSGRVMLDDSLPAAYASIYVSRLSRGAVSDGEGRYRLDDLPPGQVAVEYSYLGRQTVTYRCALEAGEALTHDETLAEALVMLPPAIVTPAGEDAAHYVLRHVWEQAARNRRRIVGWEAALDYSLGLNDVGLVLHVVPRPALRVARAAAFVAGYSAILGLIIDHPSLRARVAATRRCERGKVSDSGQRLIECSEALTPREQQALFASGKFLSDDIFDDVYSDRKAWGRKGELRDSFRLVGSYGEDGRVVDVLRYAQRRRVTLPTVMVDSGAARERVVEMVVELHVVEDVWGILKVKAEGPAVSVQRECRDVGGGIYMPVSARTSMKVPTLRADELPARIRAMEQYDLSAMKARERAMHRRMLDELRAHQGRDIDLQVGFAYNISYRRFEATASAPGR